VLVLLALATSSLGACTKRGIPVAGSEAPHLGDRIAGHIVWTTPRGGIAALSLPSGTQSVVRVPAAASVSHFATVHALSGPDAEGRIAYIEDHFFTANERDRRHRLKTIRVDGTRDEVVFERPGAAMWASSAAGSGGIGSHLALAAHGGRVALLRGLTARQLPGRLFHTGTLEIWDVQRRESHAGVGAAVDAPMAWLPDGKRLLYVEFVARRDLPAGVTGTAAVGDVAQGWDAVPAVRMLDVDTGRSSFVCVGTWAVAGFDGATAWIGVWDPSKGSTWLRVDLDRHTVERMTIPGLAAGLVAAVADDLVLYQGWPTAG
jgi:hypothetical protein